ncbi:MAG: hypothetical protein K6T83_12305, partial [Alicyclobacillus sp.]|nr:hypothetical protein [Alicyclobacillus sp.]
VQYVDGPAVMARVARVGAIGSVTTNIHTGGQATPAEQALSSAGLAGHAQILSHLDEVALAVAERLRHPFYDLDDYVEASTGRRIRDIFTEDGELAFRALEERALRQLTNADEEGRCVLATGGGIVTTAACRDLLRDTWTTVYLAASAATLAERLQAEVSHRPLLQSHTHDLTSRLESLLADRRRFYQEVADWTVCVDGRDVAEIVEEIIRHLQ